MVFGLTPSSDGACGVFQCPKMSIRCLNGCVVVSYSSCSGVWPQKVVEDEPMGGWTFPSFSLSFTLNNASASWFYCVFISVPSLWIVLCGTYFCYESFDLFQLCPSIEINYILNFHFSPYSFNFQIAFKSLNIFDIENFSFSILSFNWNW